MINKNKRKEDVIVKGITDKLKDMIKNEEKYYKIPIKVSDHLNILKDITALPNNRNKNGKWELIFGNAEQDIVVYLDDTNEKYKIEIPFNNDIVKATKSFPKESEKHKSYCVIPYVIFEVKYNNLNTHQITVYSSVASQIKNIFPHVMYNLLIIKTSKTDQTLLRHGKNFDLFIVEKSDDISKLSEKIYRIIKNRMKEYSIFEEKSN